MPPKPRYLFIVTMDVDPSHEALFNEVYDEEHVPNLLQVPGVVAVTRARKRPARLAIAGELREVYPEDLPVYLAVYEVESPEVLESPAWAAAVEAGRWPTQVRPHTHNRHHALHEVIGA